MFAESHIWKIRSVKPYPEAHNHLLVGRVTAKENGYVRLWCRSFHYGRVLSGIKDITVGSLSSRIIPWVRIEIINELSKDFDFQKAELKIDKKGNVLLTDRSSFCLIAPVRCEDY